METGTMYILTRENKNSFDTLRCSPAMKCLMSHNKDLNPTTISLNKQLSFDVRRVRVSEFNEKNPKNSLRNIYSSPQ